ASWTVDDAVLSFRDENFSSRIGWKEIVFEADSSIQFPDGNPYSTDRSHGLTSYPDDLLSSSPDVVSAKVRVTRAGADTRKEPFTPMSTIRKILLVAVIALLVAAPFISQFGSVSASSHREAPLISKDPLADNTDLYAFVSPDRPDTVTIIANYIPFESPAGGPNFPAFDDTVLYEINVDTDGDSKEDLTYQFRFNTETRNPDTFLYNTGPIASLDDPNWNRRQTYTVRLIRQGRGGSEKAEVLGASLTTPPDNIGPRSTPNYVALADAAVHTLRGGIKVFAGQRDDPF